MDDAKKIEIHSSVDPSAPSILRSLVRIPSTISTLFSIQIWIVLLKRTKVNKKRPELAHILKRRSRSNHDFIFGQYANHEQDTRADNLKIIFSKKFGRKTKNDDLRHFNSVSFSSAAADLSRSKMICTKMLNFSLHFDAYYAYTHTCVHAYICAYVGIHFQHFFLKNIFRKNVFPSWPLETVARRWPILFCIRQLVKMTFLACKKVTFCL